MVLYKQIYFIPAGRFVIQKMREKLIANAGPCALNFTTQIQQTPVAGEDVPPKNFVEILRQGTETRNPLYSFEISPPKTEEKFHQLMKSTAGVLSGQLALFASVTWHIPSPREKPPPDWAAVGPVMAACHVSRLLRPANATPGVLLNVSAVGLTERDVALILETACKKGGIRGLFLVRGDQWDSSSDFEHAVDLVKFVRSHTLGSDLVIGVAGYPLGHPESSSYEEDLLHLKEKVDAGADFIISQIVFDAETFLQFLADCRQQGIKVPVMAGVPIVKSGAQLRSLCHRCRVPVPEALLSRLAGEGADGGVRWSVSLTQQLLAGGVAAIHFFTLNSIDNLKEVLSRLGSVVESREAPPTDTKSKEALSD